MRSLLVAVVLAQTAPVKTAPKLDPLTRCTKHSDCVISTTQCCPGCCGPGPYATTRAAEEQLRERCAVVDCARPEKCDLVCEPPASADAFKARCVEHQCRMAPR